MVGHAGRMDPAAALARMGGVARSGDLLGLTTRRRLRRAVASGEVLPTGRGRFVLPVVDDAVRAAGDLGAVLCLRSAALGHGWSVKNVPPVPELAVPRTRRVPAHRREGKRVVWSDLAPDDVHAGMTGPLRTVVDCARRLPFDEALAVVDSALRAGDMTRDELDALRVRGAGAAAVRRVLAAADARAANPFESVLRALCLEEGLDVEPQAPLALVGGTVHPDLVCRSRRLVLEADSWTFHATRSAHGRDCARYNALVLAGWRVLRFSWEQVMLEPAYVRWVLAQVARHVEHAEVAGTRTRPA